eukprot:CAMPEP_0203684122 /NCGR_PEP_ID=MMETSP0090-20130426/47873_1 /ASSEMBLY_ACC=CAM_ASM_001088 /TAXON_ID=426623 /ORGANISM="Chaetoceros affinis, Strain CCMP159" /LENGTH=523 /DNA_ID=CAMNT_0050553285 /DNA_START=41 /DNA_END=1612 /DNA_ORIENTATION=+
MPIYGQVVIGPPGSGKTTYCNGMQQYLRLIGREALVVNLDPANEYHPPTDAKSETEAEADGNDNGNDSHSQSQSQTNSSQHLPYDTLLDTSEDVINLSTVMEELELGPNGGLMYCLEYIHHHMDEFQTMLRTKLDSYSRNNNNNNNSRSSHEKKSEYSFPHPHPHPYPYLLFDLPGQIELYTHSTTIQSILSSLISNFDMRLVMVQLIDSHYCMDVYKFISSSLLSVTTMLRLELPAVNVLSKVDLLSTYASAGVNVNVNVNANGNGNAGDVGSASNDNIGSIDNSECDFGMPFNLDFFMECQELERLLPYLDQHQHENENGHDYEKNIQIQHILDNDEEYQRAKMKRIRNSQRRNTKYYKLHQELCDVVNDFSLVSYVPLNINDAASVGRVLTKIDKANGYIFTMPSTVTATVTATTTTTSSTISTSKSGGGKSSSMTATATATTTTTSSTTSTSKSGGGKSSSNTNTNTNTNTVEDMFKCAMQVDREWGYEQIADIQERYLGLYQDVLPELNSGKRFTNKR